MDIPIKNVNINGKSSFLLRLTWNEDVGELTIFDFKNIETWTGRVTKEYCIETANILQMDLADYKIEISRGLNQTIAADKKQKYHIQYSNKLLLLKKTECASQITYKIATITLTDVPTNEILPDFMFQLTAYLNQMVADMASKDEQILQLSQERNILKEKYEKSADEILNNSSNLYAQFAVAFNSLKSNLSSKDSLGQQTDMSSVIEENLERDKKSGLLESDNSYGGDTDIDTEEDN